MLVKKLLYFLFWLSSRLLLYFSSLPFSGTEFSIWVSLFVQYLVIILRKDCMTWQHFKHISIYLKSALLLHKRMNLCYTYTLTLIHTGFGRYMILGSGELQIRNATKADMGSYRCQTRHQLTNELLTSSVAGHLIVTGMALTPQHIVISSLKHYSPRIQSIIIYIYLLYIYI